MNSLIGDASKARKELKWKPKKNIYQLINEMIEKNFKMIKKKNN